MLLGDAVMLFHRRMRHYKKYRALTDTDLLVGYNFPDFNNPRVIWLARAIFQTERDVLTFIYFLLSMPLFTTCWVYNHVQHI